MQFLAGNSRATSNLSEIQAVSSSVVLAAIARTGPGVIREAVGAVRNSTADRGRF